MTHSQERLYLIRELMRESGEFENKQVPEDDEGQKRLLRALFNVRDPRPISEEFLRIQDLYLTEETKLKGIVDIGCTESFEGGIHLWQGDITRLSCDAIVNAANSQLLGCFIPCHGCIDNAIHSAAGVQLRLECYDLMKKQGYPEPVGRAKITAAYNLPCRYVIHTVGPYVSGTVTDEDRRLLENCYLSCLELSREKGIKSIAFCCISTGEFHFPNEEAARIAVNTVKNFREKNSDCPEVIFNVFKDRDLEIYRKLLG